MSKYTVEDVAKLCNYTVDELDKMPTLCCAQADDLKIDTGTMRVWLCRVTDNITVELFEEDSGTWGAAL